MHRSFLFVPAHKEALIEKAIKSSADTIIFDFEDSVPESDHKQEARDLYQKYLSEARKTHVVWVRMNDPASDFFHGDLKSMKSAQPDAILHPKIDSRDDFEVRMAAQYATGVLSLGAALIESPKGLANIAEICRSHFIHSVVFGNEDYEAALLCLRPQQISEMLIARGSIALHAKANGILAVDTVTINFKNEKYLTEQINSAVRLGFDGKLCLSPNELGIVNAAFTPTTEELSEMHRILELHHVASSAGSGVSQVSNTFVGPPMVRRAKRIIAKFGGAEK